MRQFASETVKECAESVAEDNPDLTKSQAFAICQSMENEGELEECPPPEADLWAAASALEITDELPDACLEAWKEAAEQREHSTPDEGLRLLETHFDGPGEVRREEQDDGSIRYKNLLLLAPGEWTDAASEEQLFYAPEAIEKIAEDPGERVVDNSVNLNHEHRDQLLQAGHYDEETLQTDDEGALFGDVVLWNDTTASQDAVALMDRALKTEGEQGAGGLSVEIPFEGEVTEWDSERGMEKMVEFLLSGLGIVKHAASEPAAFEEQFAERSVAMAEAEQPQIRLMQHAGETDIKGSRQADDMDEDALRSLLQEETVDTDELLTEGDVRDIVEEELQSGDGETETDHELADALDAVEEVVGMALDEGFEGSVAELLTFVEENLDVSDDQQQALSEVADAYLEAVDAESLEETPVDQFREYIAAQQDDNEDEEEEGEEGEEGGDGDEDGDEEEEGRENAGGDGDSREELQEQVDELERRLQEIEDEPQKPRTLSETAEPDGNSSAGPVSVLDGHHHDGEYIGR